MEAGEQARRTRLPVFTLRLSRPAAKAATEIISHVIRDLICVERVPFITSTGPRFLPKHWRRETVVVREQTFSRDLIFWAWFA